ncbi:hypothetical protein [Thalassobaculum sp.]|uniref:hypothetical protein n=1 Tax=Thalassobaculum sp. TaxID=2022740 RepID=UPI0032EC816D
MTDDANITSRARRIADELWLAGCKDGAYPRDIIAKSIVPAVLAEQAAEIARLRDGGASSVKRLLDRAQGAEEAAAKLRADLDSHRAVVEMLRDEIAELRDGGWRPIDDEAKRAAEILAYSEHGGTGVMLVRWIAMVDFLTDSEIEELIRQGASADMLETPDWFHADFIHGDRLSPDCYPTHWMPCPPLPIDTGDDNG